ncbi:MAG TPA: hypothetical protein VMB50_09165 [Myxococcales bacterium]|nr:hypothetical protein [Myxococcales bacterium]
MSSLALALLLAADTPQAVYLTSKNPAVRLERVPPGVSPDRHRGYSPPWRTVCAVPCAAHLDPGARYRVAGDDVLPLLLTPDNLGDGHLDVHPVSLKKNILGEVLAVLGGEVIVAGALLEEPALAASDRGFEIAGGITLAIGVAAVAVGIPLWVANHATGVTAASQSP